MRKQPPAFMQSGHYAAAEREKSNCRPFLEPQLAEAQVNLGLSCFPPKALRRCIGRACQKRSKAEPEFGECQVCFAGISEFKFKPKFRGGRANSKSMSAFDQNGFSRGKVTTWDCPYLALERFPAAEERTKRRRPYRRPERGHLVTTWRKTYLQGAR